MGRHGRLRVALRNLSGELPHRDDNLHVVRRGDGSAAGLAWKGAYHDDGCSSSRVDMELTLSCNEITLAELTPIRGESPSYPGLNDRPGGKVRGMTTGWPGAADQREARAPQFGDGVLFRFTNNVY